MEEKETDSKEVSDALHMLLHCSLKDTEYETQKEQFKIVNAYIKQLEKENKNMTEEYLVNNPGMAKYLNDNYIFKSKVKEKMKKYEWSLNGYDSSTADYKHSQCIGRYLALQELLREE